MTSAKVFQGEDYGKPKAEEIAWAMNYALTILDREQEAAHQQTREAIMHRPISNI